MTIAIAFNCTNASTSAGSGFSTGGATSGSTSTIARLPLTGEKVITYGITCSQQGVMTSAQCSVKIASSTITLKANPAAVPRAATTTVGWTTTDMRECTASSPQMPDFTERNADRKHTNAIVATPPITEDADIVLRCTTLSGTVKIATTTIYVLRQGSVTSSIEGKTVSRGSDATIQWQFIDELDVSAVSLWLYDVQEGRPVALIARNRAAQGIYAWEMPHAGDQCPTDSADVCAKHLVPGRAYAIQAALYTPPNAYLGGMRAPGTPDPAYLGAAFIDEPFTIAQ